MVAHLHPPPSCHKLVLIPPQAHMERVRVHNQGRSEHGRFLLGHELVDSGLGGVFLVDDSTAMPAGVAVFMLDQVRGDT